MLYNWQICNTDDTSELNQYERMTLLGRCIVGLSSLESCCGRPKMRNSVLEGLRDRKLEDIQLDTLIIVFSRCVMLWEKSRPENDKRTWDIIKHKLKAHLCKSALSGVGNRLYLRIVHTASKIFIYLLTYLLYLLISVLILRNLPFFYEVDIWQIKFNWIELNFIIKVHICR